MGRCTLTFDQIEIINKKTGTGHLDNDWLIVSWLVNGQPVGDPERFGMWILDSGQAVWGVQCQGVACNDNDVVTAVISMVNLDALDYSDQVKTVGDLGRDIAQEAAKIYLWEVKTYLKYAGYVDLPDLPGPLADLAADLIDKLEGPIVDGIGKVFDDIIIPLLNDLISEVRVLLGSANCNGDVLHDALIFPPGQFWDTAIDKTYEAAHITGCGSSARTRVHMTMHREFEVVPGFANTPPPQVDIVPSESDFDFAGDWVNDPTSRPPWVIVSITPHAAGKVRVARASGPRLYDVTVLEHVDSRFDADFEAAATGVAAHWGNAFPYVGDEHGAIRSVMTHPLTPAGLGVMVNPGVARLAAPATGTKAAKKGKSKRSAKTSGARGVSTAITRPAPPNLIFKLNWRTIQSSSGAGGIVPLKFSGPEGAKSVPAGAGLLGERFWMLTLPGQGVTLVGLDAQLNGKKIGGTIRYIRDQNMSFTRSDVMLAPPIKLN